MKTTRKLLIILFFCIGLLGICPSAVSAAETDDTLPVPILTPEASSDGNGVKVDISHAYSSTQPYPVKHTEFEYSASPKFKDAEKVTVARTLHGGDASYTFSNKKIKKYNGQLYVRTRELYVTDSDTEIYGPWSEPVSIVRVKLSKKNFPGLYKALKSGTYNAYVRKGDSSYTLKEFPYDTNQDGWLTSDELSHISNLTVSDSLSDLKGIEYLTSLWNITLNKFTGTKADFSNNPKLSHITIERQESKEITIISPTATYISVTENFYKDLKKIDLSACDNAVEITADGGQGTLTTLKLPKEKSNLRILSISSLKCDTLDLNAYKNLEQLYIYGGSISSINVKKCKELRYCYLFYCSTIKSLDLSANTKLKGADFYKNDKLTVSNVKAPKKAKITSNTGKWWYDTDSYEKDMKRINKYK